MEAKKIKKLIYKTRSFSVKDNPEKDFAYSQVYYLISTCLFTRHIFILNEIILITDTRSDDDREEKTLEFVSLIFAIFSTVSIFIICICFCYFKKFCCFKQALLPYHQDVVTLRRVPSIISQASSETEFCRLRKDQ